MQYPKILKYFFKKLEILKKHITLLRGSVIVTLLLETVDQPMHRRKGLFFPYPLK
jgi:hypothetical protein